MAEKRPGVGTSSIGKLYEAAVVPPMGKNRPAVLLGNSRVVADDRWTLLLTDVGKFECSIRIFKTYSQHPSK